MVESLALVAPQKAEVADAAAIADGRTADWPATTDGNKRIVRY
jgi:hypothetical protein